MNVTRRQFAAFLAGASVAFARTSSQRIIERRVYDRAGVIPPDSVLRRSGIGRFYRHEGEKHIEFLISFDSFAERTRAWDRFNGDAEWWALRTSREVILREISFFS